MFFIAQMDGQFLTQGPFQHRLRDLRKQTIRAEKINPFRFRAGQQRIRQGWVDHVRRPLRPIKGSGHGFSVRHRGPFRTGLPVQTRTTTTYTDDLTRPTTTRAPPCLGPCQETDLISQVRLGGAVKAFSATQGRVFPGGTARVVVAQLTGLCVAWSVK